GRLAPGTPPAYRLFARVSFPRLEALDARVTGSPSGRVRLEGHGFEAADRRARARVVLTHAMIRGVPLEHGAARAVVDGARVRLASARVTGPELHANASGNLDLARSVADLTLGARADLTQLGRRLGRPLAGAASLSASAAGPLAALAARVTATVERPLYGALGADHLSARLALGPLCVLTGGPRCAGQVTARAALTGTAAAPVVDATARAEGLAVDDVRYGVLSLDAHAADTRASLHAVLVHPEAGELRAGGTVPLDLAWTGPRRDLGAAPLELELR